MQDIDGNETKDILTKSENCRHAWKHRICQWRGCGTQKKTAKTKAKMRTEGRQSGVYKFRPGGGGYLTDRQVHPTSQQRLC